MNKRYSPKQKEEARFAVIANGGRIRQTAREMGIPYPTLRRFVQVSFPHKGVRQFVSEYTKTIYAAFLKDHECELKHTRRADVSLNRKVIQDATAL